MIKFAAGLMAMGQRPRRQKADRLGAHNPGRPVRLGLSAVVCGLLLGGCQVAAGGYSAGVLCTQEVTRFPDGTVKTSVAPDRVALGGFLGSATTILTGSPWGVLAGGAAQISESAARVLTVPVDVVTSAAQARP